MIEDTKRALTSEFSDVFDVSGPLRTMAEPPMHMFYRRTLFPFQFIGPDPSLLLNEYRSRRRWISWWRKR